MSDEFVAGGILPVDNTASDDADFDPDAIESDVFLDDAPDAVLDVDDIADVVSEENDELLEEDV